MKTINFEEFPSPEEDRYNLQDSLGSGNFGECFQAIDNQAAGKQVAIKVYKLDEDNERYISQEYNVLVELSSHSNLPDFYGLFNNNGDVWFIMEFCGGGSAIDLVNGLLAKNRRMAEEHIALILKEIVKAINYLHDNKIMHRNIKASNILLTNEGEIKLTDFTLSCSLLNTFDKVATCLGSPCWMAPEQINSKNGEEYDNRIDVWAIGITAIELADGIAPYQNMHPSRATFQITRNPPPTLYRTANWSLTYNDFINECLIKNPEHRPFIMEVIEHPFFELVPENSHHLNMEIKNLIETIDRNDIKKNPENFINGNFVKKNYDQPLKEMVVEDLAALDDLSEDNIIRELKIRMEHEEYQSFVGDVFLFLNPNKKLNMYGDEYHQKYIFKSRSDNAPHIFSVADTAYQNALHHKVPQRIILGGESGSGKTTNFLHLVNHLLYLGYNININVDRIKTAINVIHSFINASTPINNYSTRAVFKTCITFGETGKVSGAVFKIYQLEKLRVSYDAIYEGNFHIFYYIYDGLKNADRLEEFKLNENRNYRYLKIANADEKCNHTPKYNIEKNIKKFSKIMQAFEDFTLSEEEMNTIFSVIAAILLLGEINFLPTEDEYATIENEDDVQNVADLLKIDSKKLTWALTNYCLVDSGAAIRKQNTLEEANNARDFLANNLYVRLVDFVVSILNHKLSVGRQIFGDNYSVKIFDYFGFECFKSNHLSQLFINCFNEQIQYHYLQRIFSWESLDVSSEEIEYYPVRYYDNKNTLDKLLGKPDGLFAAIDEASKQGEGPQFVIDYMQSQDNPFISLSGEYQLSVAHYTGTVTYDLSDMPSKNRDFLVPELTETLRRSSNPIIKGLFTHKLDKTGNLLVSFDEDQVLDEEDKGNQYSQIRRMRTAIGLFRGASLDLLKELAIGSVSGDTHFVRCIRSDLKNQPNSFDGEIIRQQLRAMSVTETAKARKRGFPYRVPFPDFLQRYKFLAFDFDENVDITRDNCRLLLIRLKMEGWTLGKTKVFLKYYNEEYLSRLYETQVKKIVKIQSVLRGFLVKCRMAKQKREESGGIKSYKKSSNIVDEMSENEAALVIQKAYKGKKIKKAYNQDYAVLDEKTANFIKGFAKKWRYNSLFHILIMIRSSNFQDFFNLSQQVHFYNQNVFWELEKIHKSIHKNFICKEAKVDIWIGKPKLAVSKLPFRLDEVPFYNTSHMTRKLNKTYENTTEYMWDMPYRYKEFVSQKSYKPKEMTLNQKELIQLPYSRDSTNKSPYKLSKYYDEDEQKSSKETKNLENQSVRSRSTKQHNTMEKQISYNKSSFESKYNSNNTIYNKSLKDDLKLGTKPANKDFEYIPSPNISKSKNDPISELRSLAKQNSSEDEPPFNFQAMLRKTNYQNDSFKRSNDNIRTFSFTKKQKQENININKEYDKQIKGKEISVQLSPGVIIEGVEVDL